MPNKLSTVIRTDNVQNLITRAGANARVKLYNGAQHASLGTPPGTLLATLIAGTVLGTATNGAIDWDEANFTQTNSSHVAGTPTYMRIETSAGVACAEYIFGAGGYTLSGAVATGQNVTLTALTTTAGDV